MLLEFTRENILLKRNLYFASVEVDRLQNIIQVVQFRSMSAQHNVHSVMIRVLSLLFPFIEMLAINAVLPCGIQRVSHEAHHETHKKSGHQHPDEEPKSQRRYWTDQEHERFLDAIQNFGHKNVKAIAAYVGTRSATQVRTHAQKYFLKAARENKARENAKCILQGEGTIG